jgi:hypothetical protein
MAVDKSLIQGAAALAQSEGNMSRAFGAGLTQEATRIAGDIMKREEERQAQVKNDMNLAAQFIGKMASTGTAAGQYKNILTSEGMNVKNRLNEIALDPSLNAVEKAAAYTRAVDEYNVLASTYAGDQEKLVNLQGIVRAGNYSNTVNRNTEEFEIARALGTGNYEIVKDGYVVNGKTITSAELDNYVGLYKPKNMEAFSTFDGQLRNSIRSAKGNKDVEKSILNEAINIPTEQKLNYLVDYKDQAYSNFVNENNELNEETINTAYKTEMDNLQIESAVAPLVETKEDDASIGIQYYNLLKGNLTDEAKLLPFLSSFGIREGADIDDGTIKSVERTEDGIKVTLEEDGKTKEVTQNSTELLDLILNNLNLTTSQAQQLQLKLFQEPIQLGKFKEKTSNLPTSTFLQRMQKAIGFGN